MPAVENIASAAAECDFQESVVLVFTEHLVNYLSNQVGDEFFGAVFCCIFCHFAFGFAFGDEWQFWREVDAENVLRRRCVWPFHLDFSINASGPQNRRIYQVWPVRREDDNHVVQGFDAVHLRAEHWH